MFLKQTFAREGKYASFNNIKFPRGNNQTDSSQSKTLFGLYCSPPNFLSRASSRIILIIFNFFRWQPWRPNVKSEGKKLTNTDLIQFQLFIFYKSPCLQKNFNRRVLSIRVFSADGHYMAPRTNSIASGDQFKPIRIGENLVVNYHAIEIETE